MPEAPALERARAAGVETRVFDLGDHPSRERRDLAIADWLAERKVGLVVLAGYMQLLTAPFLARFPGRILNIHPSLLPAFPGTAALADALAHGVRWTGVTVHLVDEGVDSGPIVLQEPVAIEPEDTLESLRVRVQAVEHRLLPKAARLFLEGRVRLPPGSRRVVVS